MHESSHFSDITRTVVNFMMTSAKRYVARDVVGLVTQLKSVECNKSVGEIFDEGEEVMQYKTGLDELVSVSAPCLMKLFEVIRDDEITDDGRIFQYEELPQSTLGPQGREIEPTKVVTTSTLGPQGP